jgi:hypothetical protein
LAEALESSVASGVRAVFSLQVGRVLFTMWAAKAGQEKRPTERSAGWWVQ